MPHSSLVSCIILFLMTPVVRSAKASHIEHTGATKRPNIVHILVDDFGWEQVGYHHDPDAYDGERT
jgi:hypothetical protein